MISSDKRERIRRAYFLENKSITAIAKEEACCRESVRKALCDQHEEVLAPKSTHPSQRGTVFPPFEARVREFLAQNDHLPRKQRYTTHKIFEIIQTEGYQGCESRVRQFAGEWHRAHRLSEVFLPLVFEPGQDAQCDWVRRVGAYEIPV